MCSTSCDHRCLTNCTRATLCLSYWTHHATHSPVYPTSASRGAPFSHGHVTNGHVAVAIKKLLFERRKGGLWCNWVLALTVGWSNIASGAEQSRVLESACLCSYTALTSLTLSSPSHDTHKGWFIKIFPRCSFLRNQQEFVEMLHIKVICFRETIWFLLCPQCQIIWREDNYPS